ncbi:homing endonuclease associated repeat-containing protein [Halostella litorea]|uniref:homing endonuclease associated repeat-containing protein n=1 Tax=Halostella litorea TaxID=2528831 RepID=UPI0010926157|nr:HNH endonuclease [Halostella litorea]
MTTEEEYLDALSEAARELGESPTKAQYEELGLRPASATILRVMGSWNAAKEAAGLETFERGSLNEGEVQPKPDDVDLSDREWRELSGYQRWYRKNRESEIRKKDRRRAELRRWLHVYKRDNCACERCGEGNPACLDFHHPGEKDLGISAMVVYGYSKANIGEEINRCTVLCANCHRKEHYSVPPGVGSADE